MEFSVPIFTQSKIISSKSLRTDVAATTWTVEDMNQEIRICVECIILKCEQKTVHSKLMKSKQLVTDESVLEHRLDVDELQELRYMSMRPNVKNIMSSIFSKLEDFTQYYIEKGRKWLLYLLIEIHTEL